ARATLETVRVSATRLESDLLKTPVTVTAVTQDALTREGVRDVRGLSGSMPNLQIASGPDSGVQVSIRGIGANNFTEIGDPAVGLHVAGLYSPRPQGALALMFDVDQVEVLRGPQGTLFGRNSTGGSINIIPAKPRFDS
ncbi:Plug domain-containing protein, partial [Xanthomonas citri pv. citri]